MTALEPLSLSAGALAGEEPPAAAPIPANRLLYGKPDPLPGQTRLTEQPWHRAAAYLLAGGTSCQDTAKACNVSPQTITNLLKNDWFQRLVTELIAEHGGKDVMELFKGEAVNSFATLIELRDDARTSAKVKQSIAEGILDRVLGKSVQRIEQLGAVRSNDPVKELEQLQAENEKLREQL